MQDIAVLTIIVAELRFTVAVLLIYLPNCFGQETAKWSDLCGLRVKLSPVTISQTTQRSRHPVKCHTQGHKRTCRPLFILSVFF